MQVGGTPLLEKKNEPKKTSRLLPKWSDNSPRLMSLWMFNGQKQESLVNSYGCLLLMLVEQSIDHKRQLVGRANALGDNLQSQVPAWPLRAVSQSINLENGEKRTPPTPAPSPLHLWFLFQTSPPAAAHYSPPLTDSYILGSTPDETDNGSVGEEVCCQIRRGHHSQGRETEGVGGAFGDLPFNVLT